MSGSTTEDRRSEERASAWQPPVVTSGPLGDSIRRPFSQELKEVWGPIKVYHLLTLVMILVFSVVALTHESGDETFLLFLGALWVVTFSGAAFGQALALWRIRSWVVAAGSALWWTLTFTVFLSIAESHSSDRTLAVMFLATFFFPLFAWGGLFSLRIKRALPSSWVPLMYGVASIIIIIEETSRVSAWRQGDKHEIWGLGSILVLATTVALLVVYLVLRERHRLSRWQRAPGALLEGAVEASGAARARLTVGGSAVLVLLAAVLTLGTAVAAPYLWRTGPGNYDDDDPAWDDGDDDRDRGRDPAGDESGDFWERLGQGLQRAVEAMVEVARSYWPLLLLLLLLLLALMASWRPARRALLLRYLLHPPWPLPATRRIENGWKAIELALGDHGLHRQPKETAVALTQRTIADMKHLPPEMRQRLLEAASIRDRVTYGLGVGARDEQTMIDEAKGLYSEIRAMLLGQEKVRSLYRRV